MTNSLAPTQAQTDRQLQANKYSSYSRKYQVAALSTEQSDEDHKQTNTGENIPFLPEVRRENLKLLCALQNQHGIQTYNENSLLSGSSDRTPTCASQMKSTAYTIT